jgi:triacylglycerol esterase/lipase EstA (alpha/beta hydrolase family)
VRESSFNLPLITGGTANWTATSTSDWSDDPNKVYDQASTVLGDYCAAGKTLQSRAHFVVYNKSVNTLTLHLRLVRDDGSNGATPSEYAASDSFTVDASAHVNVTTAWQGVGCSTPETLVYFYSTQTKAGNSGSINQQFSVVYSALELRYQ